MRAGAAALRLCGAVLAFGAAKAYVGVLELEERLEARSPAKVAP